MNHNKSKMVQKSIGAHTDETFPLLIKPYCKVHMDRILFSLLLLQHNVFRIVEYDVVVLQLELWVKCLATVATLPFAEESTEAETLSVIQRMIPQYVCSALTYKCTTNMRFSI